MSVLLQACSTGGFHLRKEVELPAIYKTVSLVNIPDNREFVEAFSQALEVAGGRVDAKALSQIIFKQFQEGKRITALTSERKAREYLLSLKIEYQIEQSVSGQANKKSKPYRLNIDRPFLYDADFSLGKAEEEKQIKNGLYEEAARLILLRLQYSKF